jgi:hypothetical protein
LSVSEVDSKAFIRNLLYYISNISDNHTPAGYSSLIMQDVFPVRKQGRRSVGYWKYTYLRLYINTCFCTKGKVT